jgi:hypothetical protein
LRSPLYPGSSLGNFAQVVDMFGDMVHAGHRSARLLRRNTRTALYILLWGCLCFGLMAKQLLVWGDRADFVTHKLGADRKSRIRIC